VTVQGNFEAPVVRHIECFPQSGQKAELPGQGITNPMLKCPIIASRSTLTGSGLWNPHSLGFHEHVSRPNRVASKAENTTIFISILFRHATPFRPLHYKAFNVFSKKNGFYLRQCQEVIAAKAVEHTVGKRRRQSYASERQVTPEQGAP